MLPGLALIRDYPRGALRHDLAAGLALSAVLVPVGMGYAQACGLPAIHGLYATIAPLLAYALFGPSRVLVLGPDSTLAAVIAAIVLPLAAGNGECALAQAATLALPPGLPLPALPAVVWADLEALLPGALVIALLVFADTSVLSRAMAARAGNSVDPNREMLALGAANLAAGCWQGFPISASSSRTPVAEAAGARTQLTGVVGAAAIVVLLVAAPGLLADLPRAALAAVVIAASFSFADLPAMATLWRQRRSEFGLALVAFVGVAFIGVIEGVVVAMGLSVLLLFWNAWHPYDAVLVRVDGRRGWHDRQRHPEGLAVPGLLLFRWDAELFFANAEVFRERLQQAMQAEAARPRWIVIAADAITDIDVTAADMLGGLDRELEAEGTQLRFAGLKGPVKDWLVRYGFGHQFDPSHFDATVSAAVDAYRAQHAVDGNEGGDT